MRTRRHPRPIAVLGGLAIAAGFAGVAFGSHTFSDVQTSTFYHADVTWARDQGLTVGCTTTTYCPTDAVTRGQMAAFLHRMASRGRTGHFSCSGAGFVPAVSSSTYFTAGSIRHGGGYFVCNVVLPEGAKVTRLRLAAVDTNPSSYLTLLLLRQTEGDVEDDQMALLTTNFSSGEISLDTTQIADAVIDNAAYRYVLFVEMFGADGSMGILGASVGYTYQGSPAP